MLKTEGIVLKEMRYQESSKILNIYTKRYGKIPVMVKGAYKPKSQLIANTQIFSHNEYQLHKGKSFYYLTQADILESFYSIRGKMERVIYGYYILELVDKSIPDEQENEKIFMLLEKGLRVLSKLDEDFLKFIIAYELKFISFLGYKPYMERCVLCYNTNANTVKFSISEGGIICNDCFSMDSTAIYLNREIYETMNNLLYIPLERTSEVVASEDSLYKLHQIIVEYILYNIDRKAFNSLDLMESLN